MFLFEKQTEVRVDPKNQNVIACLCGPQNAIQNILGCSYALTDSNSAKSLED